MNLGKGAKQNRSRTGARAPRPSKIRPPTSWKIPPDQIITSAGSLVSDVIWDMSEDHDSIGLTNWDAEIRVGGVLIGRLSDPAYQNLLAPLQQSVAVRWCYATREDGRRWKARRTAAAIAAGRRFAQWLAEAGVTRVEDIRERHLLAWISKIAVCNDGETRTSRDQRVLCDAPLLLWRMRDRIGATLGFVPKHIWPEEWILAKYDGTSTPLMPKAVLDHVIGAACRYIELYSRDVLAARAYVDGLVAEWERRHGRPHPTYRKGCKDYTKFDHWIGHHFGYRNLAARRAMGRVAPWNEDGLFLRDPETGEPWLDHIRSRLHLQELENTLRTACFIVIAFMTGGRSSEIVKLEIDCAHSAAQVGGRPSEHSIVGIVTKHQPQPTEVSWGVPEVAIAAAGLLLKMLASWRERTGSNRLLVSQTGNKVDNRLINSDLKVFIERIGAPYVGGKPFPLAAHMLRVALAQWLGAEPYGEIAGAFQLKQLSTAAFRGYLRDDPEFQSLYEAFVVQASADHLAVVLDEPILGGRKGAEIMASRSPERQAELEANVRALNLAQVGREAPSPRLMKRWKKQGQALYKTRFTNCVFKPDTAECLRGVPLAERNRPKTHECNPLSCGNSALTRLEVPAYLEDFESYLATRDDPTSSPSQIELAKAEAGGLARLLSPFVPTLQAEVTVLEGKLVGTDEREAETIAMRKRQAEVGWLLGRIAVGRVLELANAA